MTRPLPLTCLLLGLLVLASLCTGAASMSPLHLLGDPEGLRLLLLSRVPRTAAAMLSGAAMAVAGVILQLLVRNRFVEPGTTGTVEAAMLGLLAVTMLSPGAPILAKMAVAAAAALAGMAGFLALIRRLPPEEPLMVPLVGIIYSGIIGAGTTFVAYQADLLQYLGTWMNGEFSGVLAGRYELLWLAGLVAGLAYLYADRFTIAGLGRTASIGLGLNYAQTLWIGLLTVSVVTAMVVVTVGAIPFVGLVVPNIVARIMGDNLRGSLPVMAAMGAALVLGSDVLGRIIRFPYEIPAGTIFGAVGAAVFLWLLLGPKPRAR
ncbi:ABC transporter permease [Mangrovicoccus algicola]|uniref:Iron chelate uptake ABC transporter family permease subunit n=1 Tax=Mangrovicoccus algicola TaxID=2771008 RepID=A0A8J7CV16_9RHOB|nr:iron chelate uptake ABC transporter family permease subunit [Mangrovicoccus algicola]MBE3638219.1 iron chelate uptake ABC transporter family permease subunit [Mangrovicoccus algicola]